MSEWKWGISADEERWDQFELATREEALAEGASYYGGGPFYVGKCRRKPFKPSIGGADRILEHVEEQAGAKPRN